MGAADLQLVRNSCFLMIYTSIMLANADKSTLASFNFLEDEKTQSGSTCDVSGLAFDVQIVGISSHRKLNDYGLKRAISKIWIKLLRYIPSVVQLFAIRCWAN